MIKVYHEQIEQGEVAPRGCRHAIVDHVAEICEDDLQELVTLGYTLYIESKGAKKRGAFELPSEDASEMLEEAAAAESEE